MEKEDVKREQVKKYLKEQCGETISNPAHELIIDPITYEVSYLPEYQWEQLLRAWDNNEMPSWTRKINKSVYLANRPKKTSYLYLTLSPDKILRNLDCTTHNIQALKHWCERWFPNQPKYYGNWCYVVENGSQGDHLHVHAVMEMKNSHKHAEYLKKSWAKTFPNNQLITGCNLRERYKCKNCMDPTKNCNNPKHRGEYCYYGFDDPEVLSDKLDYFINEKKGLHENLTDLGVRGSKGFNTDNSN